jgi:hypothetical protein
MTLLKSTFTDENSSNGIKISQILTDFCIYVLMQDSEPHAYNVLFYFGNRKDKISYYRYKNLINNFIDLSQFLDDTSDSETVAFDSINALNSLITEDEILGLEDYLNYEFKFGYPDGDGLLGNTSLNTTVKDLKRNFNEYWKIFSSVKFVEGFTYFLQYTDLIAGNHSAYIKGFENYLELRKELIDNSKDVSAISSLQSKRDQLIVKCDHLQNENICQFQIFETDIKIGIDLFQSAAALSNFNGLLDIPIENVEDHLALYYLKYFELYFEKYFEGAEMKPQKKNKVPQWEMVANFIAGINFEYVKDQKIHSNVFYLINNEQIHSHKKAAEKLKSLGLFDLGISKIENVLSESFKWKGNRTSNNIFHQSHAKKLGKMKKDFNTSLGNQWFWETVDYYLEID